MLRTFTLTCEVKYYAFLNTLNVYLILSVPGSRLSQELSLTCSARRTRRGKNDLPRLFFFSTTIHFRLGMLDLNETFLHEEFEYVIIVLIQGSADIYQYLALGW